MSVATLTTLTPVHVGNGQKMLRDFDFIIEGNKVGFVDLEKVAILIGGDRQSIIQLTNAIEKKESILKFLKEGRGIKDIKLEQVCSRISLLNGHAENNTGELKEHFSTSMKGPCIPGSSLKGAFRSGILKYLTSEVRNSESQLKNFINGIEWGARPDQVFKTLERTLFGNDANSKTTRFLTVGDIQFKNLKTEVYELSYENLINARTNEWVFEQRKAQLVECIPANTNATFHLKVNLDLASKYTTTREEVLAHGGSTRMEPLRDLSVYGMGEVDFLKNINQSTISTMQNDYYKLDQMKMHEDFLIQLDQLLTIAENCKEGEAVVRVGGHSGWNYITNRWMIYESEEVLSNNTYDRLRSKVQKTDRYLRINIFPKTRKMTEGGIPLGFVKISLK